MSFFILNKNKFVNCLFQEVLRINQKDQIEDIIMINQAQEEGSSQSVVEELESSVVEELGSKVVEDLINSGLWPKVDVVEESQRPTITPSPRNGWKHPLFLNPSSTLGLLVCSICENVANNCSKCACKDEHLFCEECIVLWLDSSGKSVCPINQEVDLDRESLSPAHLARSIISEHYVQCITCITNIEIEKEEAGDGVEEKELTSCTWTGKLQNLSEHLHSCPSFQQSGSSILCPDCGTEVNDGLLKVHKMVCANRLVRCDNNGCKMSLPFQNKHKHAATCLYETVPCPYQESVGCNVSCYRKDLVEHVADTTHHVSCLVKTFADFKADSNLRMESVVSELQKENAVLKQDLYCLKVAVGTSIRGVFEHEYENYKIPGAASSTIFEIGGFKLQLNLTSDQPASSTKGGKPLPGNTALTLVVIEGWPAQISYKMEIINSNTPKVSNKGTGSHFFEYSKEASSLNMLQNDAMLTYVKNGKVTCRVDITIEIQNTWTVGNKLRPQVVAKAPPSPSGPPAKSRRASII